MTEHINYEENAGVPIGADLIDVAGDPAWAQRVKVALGENDEYAGDVAGVGGIDGVGGRGAMFTRVRPNTFEVQPSIAVDTAAYAANDVVGGLIEIPDAVDVAGNLLRIESIRLHWLQSAGAATLSCWLFADEPVAVFTDQAGFPVLTNPDVAKLRWIYNFFTQTPGVTTPTGLRYSSASVPDTDDMPHVALAGTSLWMVWATAGAITFSSAAAFHATIVAERL